METKIRTEETSWGRLQHRLFRMVSIGTVSDPLSLGYDIFSSLALIVNLTAAFMMTYDHLAQTYGTGLTLVLEVTTAFFGVDYVHGGVSVPKCRKGPCPGQVRDIRCRPD